MLIRDVMSKHCKWCAPTATMNEAARLMAQNDFGSLPVAERNKLIGMVTDRDMIVRGLAQGQDPETARLRDIMTDRIYYCFDDQSCDEVAANMAEMQVRRMPVLTRDKKLVGIVSLGDLSRKTKAHEAEQALKGISRSN